MGNSLSLPDDLLILFIDTISAAQLSTIEMTQEDLSRQLHGEPGHRIQVVTGSGESQRTVRLKIKNLLCQSPLIVTR